MFLRIVIPLSLPGVVSGALIMFNLCMGAFVSAALLGGGKVLTLPVIIERTLVLETALRDGGDVIGGPARFRVGYQLAVGIPDPADAFSAAGGDLVARRAHSLDGDRHRLFCRVRLLVLAGAGDRCGWCFF